MERGDTWQTAQQVIKSEQTVRQDMAQDGKSWLRSHTKPWRLGSPFRGSPSMLHPHCCVCPLQKTKGFSKFEDEIRTSTTSFLASQSLYLSYYIMALRKDWETGPDSTTHEG